MFACPDYNRIRYCRRLQVGQILPVTLFALITTIALVILLFNTGQRITQKTQAVNAADGATYSAAVWTARHLNLIAYTNRAMIANHVGAGHITSYVSWMRYVDNATVAGSTVSGPMAGMMTFFPWTAPYVEGVAEIAPALRQAAEASASPAITALDAANQLYYAAQLDARAGLAFDGVERLMDDVAATYDADYSVNSGEIVNGFPAPIQAPVSALQATQQVRLAALIENLQPTDRERMLEQQVERTWQDNQALRDWMGGGGKALGGNVGLFGGTGSGGSAREWSPDTSPIPFTMRVRKRGTTAQSLEDDRDDTDWRASDRFQQSTWNWAKLSWSSWQTMASGSASADDLALAGYGGIPAYHDLAEDFAGGPYVPLIAVVGKSQDTYTTQNVNLAGSEGGVFSIGPRGTPVSAVGVSEVYFDRPDSCSDQYANPDRCVDALGQDQGELANLFNPFWRPRLVDLTFAVNHRGEIF